MLHGQGSACVVKLEARWDLSESGEKKESVMDHLKPLLEGNAGRVGDLSWRRRLWIDPRAPCRA